MTGAEAYLTKPLDLKEPTVRIKNLLERRKWIRDKYYRKFDAIIKSSKLNTADSEIINKVVEPLEDNIHKTYLGTEQLARELFVSRTHLHRKIIAIAGQAPGEFIRIIKLKKQQNCFLKETCQ